MDWRSIKELYHELADAFLTWLYAGNLEDTTEEGS